MLVLGGVIFLLALGAAVRATSTAQGAPIWVALALVPLFVGNALPYFFPVALMTSVVLAYGRMAADGEEVVLRAAGMTPWRLLQPALQAALLMAVVGYPVTNWVMPGIFTQMRTLSLRAKIAALENTNPSANEFQFKGLQMLWASRDPEGGFRDAVIALDSAISKDLAGGGVRLRADRVRMDVVGDELVFRFDRLRTLSDEGEESPWKASNSDGTWLRVDLASLVDNTELPRRLVKVHTSARLRERIVEEEDPLMVGRMRLVILQRWAGAAAAFPVALLGALIGWRLRRGGFLTGFAVALMVLLLVYYPVQFLGEGLLRSGRLGPALAAWLAPLCLLPISLILYLRNRAP